MLKVKRDGPGRPRSHRFEGAELLRELRAECLRRLAKIGVDRDIDIEEYVSRCIAKYRAEAEASRRDGKLAADLLAAMRAMAASAEGRSHLLERWVQTNIQPLLGDDRQFPTEFFHDEDGRKDPGSTVTDYVWAIDRMNFLSILERPATDREFACVMVVTGYRPPVGHGPVSPREVIDAVAKTVCKTRAKHGFVKLVLEGRRQQNEAVRNDPTGELGRMLSGIIRKKL